ncbi:MAG: class I SAM-dependent methyltransferase, partial [Thermoanaerobaculia bacterium]
SSLFPVVRRLLKPGGILATSAKMTGRFAAAPGELRRNFEGWEIVYEYEDGMRAELIARKT